MSPLLIFFFGVTIFIKKKHTIHHEECYLNIIISVKNTLPVISFSLASILWYNVTWAPYLDEPEIFCSGVCTTWQGERVAALWLFSLLCTRAISTCFQSLSPLHRHKGVLLCFQFIVKCSPSALLSFKNLACDNHLTPLLCSPLPTIQASLSLPW